MTIEKQKPSRKRGLVLHTSPTAFAPPWSEGQKNNLLSVLYLLKDEVIFDVFSNKKFKLFYNINIFLIDNPNNNLFQKLKFTWQISKEANKLLANKHYDYIIFNINSFNILIPLLMLKGFNNEKKVLILGSEKIYKYLEENRVRLGRVPHWLKKRIIGSFDKILCVSRKIQKEIIADKLIEEKKTLYMPAMSPVQIVEDFTPSGETSIRLPAKSADVCTVTYIGNVKKERGIYVLLEAFSKLSNQINVRLFIFSNGIGDLQLLREKIIKSKLSNVFLINSPLNPKKIFSLSNIFVLPMLTQTHVFEYPLAVLESLWYSVPVVCSDFESFREIIKNEENGLLTSPGSAEELADAITLLCGDRLLYEKIKNNAKPSLTKIYGFDIKHEILKFLDS